MSEQENNIFGGAIIQHGLEKEITQSYIDYAMSVIVSRALPDTRDGFKPVLRRILFAMYDMKMLHNTKHKKSARIVGEVLGKYHPHGDSSVYEAMVRMAQPWAMRYPLVDGQGNFGSMDGDSAAAMRYTEARLTEIAEEMTADIHQDTVAWRDNFDGSLQEPVILPTKFPNHLCNGTMGIAVGMATNTAPHNLREVIDACLLLIEKEGKEYTDEEGNIKTYEVSVDEIMEIIKGPDFPTGGIMFDSANIKEVYRRGKGGITTRGKTHLEDRKSGKIIVIDEIPYMINKANLVAKIGELVVTKKIEGVSDIRDESNKNIVRIAIYVKKDFDPDKILMQLFKYTELQTNFNLNNISLVEGGTQPRLLNIKDFTREYIVFRRVVVYRRSAFQLQKAKDRLHILQGLKKAIDIIDEVIDTIKKSDTKQSAKENLMTKYEFSDPQAEYILLMRLQSLVGLEIQRISEEIDEKEELIRYLESIINDSQKLDEVVCDELKYIKDKYGDDRRTEISQDTSVYNLGNSLKAFKDTADKVKEDIILRIGNDYSIRTLYQTRILNIPEETLDVIYTHNQDKLIIITDLGELIVHRLKDFGNFTMAKNAISLKEYFQLKGKIVFAKTLHFDYEHLLFLTRNNNIKKINKELILSFKKFPTVVMKLEPKETIATVLPVSDNDHVAVITEQGRGLMFPAGDIRPMGKTAGGVKAIDLKEGDKIANMFLHKNEPFILIHNDIEGKMLTLEDLRIRKRARKGDIRATGKCKLQGGISIEEGSIRIRFKNGEIQTLHSNDIKLDEPETTLKKMVNNPIDIIYKPREEIEENLKYKEEKKEEMNKGLFSDTNDENDNNDEENQESE